VQSIATTVKLIEKELREMRSFKGFGIALVLALSCIACHSIKVNNANMHTATTNPIALGVIGVQENGLVSSDFKVTAIPDYKQKIRIGAQVVDFTTKTFETFSKVSKEKRYGLRYVDSLDKKPSFITLELLDQVTTLSELQENYNSETLAYLKTQKKTAIVTSVSLALPTTLIQEITSAKAVFLNNAGYKQYELSLVNEDKIHKTISFTESTIFGYELSFFCWSENGKRQIVLAGMINEKSSCAKNAYRDAQKALEKMNYFKL